MTMTLLATSTACEVLWVPGRPECPSMGVLLRFSSGFPFINRATLFFLVNENDKSFASFKFFFWFMLVRIEQNVPSDICVRCYT